MLSSITFVTLFVSALASLGSAANLTIADLAPCAIACAIATAPAFNVSLTDYSGICQNIPLQQAQVLCESTHCNATEQATALQFGIQSCLENGTPLPANAGVVVNSTSSSTPSTASATSVLASTTSSSSVPAATTTSAKSNAVSLSSGTALISFATLMAVGALCL